MNGKNDCQGLMNEAALLADELLREVGAFRPFGFVIAKDDSVSSLAFDLGDDATTTQLIDFARESFKDAASAGEYVATALAYDVVIADGDAIAVELDHRDGYSVVVFKPYNLSDSVPVYGEVSAQEGQSAIFD